MYNRNAAYDFGALEERKRKKSKVLRFPNKQKILKSRSRAQKSLLTGVFSLFLISAAGVSAFIAGQVRLTEVTDKTEKAYKELEQCKSINTELEMKLESKKMDSQLEGAKSSHVAQTEIVKIPKESNFVETH